MIENPYIQVFEQAAKYARQFVKMRNELVSAGMDIEEANTEARMLAMMAVSHAVTARPVVAPSTRIES